MFKRATEMRVHVVQTNPSKYIGVNYTFLVAITVLNWTLSFECIRDIFFFVLNYSLAIVLSSEH